MLLGADWKLSKSGGIEEYGDKDKLVKLEYSGDMYLLKHIKIGDSIKILKKCINMTLLHIY